MSIAKKAIGAYTKLTFKKCKNEGCEVQIEVRNTDLGWRPFEENGNKHNCQFSDYAKKQRLEAKNDHGNEESKPVSPKEYFENKLVASGAKKILELTPEGLGLLQASNKFVDHTQAAKGQSKVKIFYAPGTEVLEEQYNTFLKINNGQIKVQGGQFQIRDSGFAIALYYEEVK